MRVSELLRYGVKELTKDGINDAEIDVQLLLGHCLEKSRTQVFLAAQDTVSSKKEREFLLLLEGRKRRQPVAYLLEEREFWSLPFYVDENVLIPRPETEFLLETAFSKVDRENLTNGRILDLCCGSGVIAIVLALELNMRVAATDISQTALGVAKKNSLRHGVNNKIDFINCNLFASLSPERKFSLIVSNPPYVRKEEIYTLEPEVRDHEPHLALDGGNDGLEIIRKIRQNLPSMLQDGGSFFMEFGAEQGEFVEKLFSTPMSGKDDFENIEIFEDYSGRQRVLHVKSIKK